MARGFTGGDQSVDQRRRSVPEGASGAATLQEIAVRSFRPQQAAKLPLAEKRCKFAEGGVRAHRVLHIGLLTCNRRPGYTCYNTTGCLMIALTPVLEVAAVDRNSFNDWM